MILTTEILINIDPPDIKGNLIKVAVQLKHRITGELVRASINTREVNPDNCFRDVMLQVYGNEYCNKAAIRPITDLVPEYKILGMWIIE